VTAVGSQPSCPECHAWPYEAHRPDCSQRAPRRRDESQHDAPPMTHADALGAYDDMPPDLPDRMSAAVAEELRRMPNADPHPHADGSRRLGRGLGALIPDGTPTRPFGDGGATVRQGDTLPTIPQRPRLSFDWNDYGQHDDAAREAIDRVVAAIRAEDARARSLLPDPPPGWEWDGELVTRESGAGVGAEVTARIVYRLREVTP